jgi:nucleoside-diphosphate-sugar epimerase
VNVQDIVQANLLAMKSENALGESFNIGSGTRISVNQVAEVLKSSLNKHEIKNNYVDPRPGDVKHGFANIEKAKSLMNYAPQHSFEQGISELIKWYIDEKQ